MAAPSRAVPRNNDGITDRTDFETTAVLLDNRKESRMRIVDEFSLMSAGMYQHRRSLQLRPIAPFLPRRRPRRNGLVAVRLPLPLMPKAPLLDFDVRPSDGRLAHLVDRETGAVFQAEFVSALADSAGVPTPSSVAKALIGVSRVMPGRLDDIPDDAMDDAPLDDKSRTRLLLASSWGTAITPELFDGWWGANAVDGGPAATLAKALSTVRSDRSTSENVLLGLVEAGFADLDTAGIERCLVDWHDWVKALSVVAAGDDERRADAASEALRWTSELGRHYVQLVDVVLDADQPYRIKISTRRELTLDSGWERASWGWLTKPWIRDPLRAGRMPMHRTAAEIPLLLDEAASQHFRVRCDDDGVELDQNPAFADSHGNPLGSFAFAGAAAGPDGFAMYLTGDAGRPREATMRLPLRLSGDVRRAVFLVAFLAVTALIAGLDPWLPLDSTGVSVIVLPTTFAAALLLTRERTTLAARLLRGIKWALIASVLLLWLTGLARLDGHVAPLRPAGASEPAPTASPASEPAVPVIKPAHPTQPPKPAG